MLRSVLGKTVRDARRGLVGWGVGIVLLVVLTVSIYPSIRGNPDFEELTENYPEELQAFVGGELDFTTGAGYLNGELFSFMIPLLLLVYAIGAGARAIAGEEEAGTLDLLLSHPVSRERVVLEKLGAVALLTGAVAAVVLLSVGLSAAAVSMDIGAGEIVAASVFAWLLAVAYGALALLVGSATGSRALAIAVPSGAAVAGYLLEGLGNLVGFLEPVQPLSPFHWYTAADPLREGLAPGWAALLLAVTAAFGALAPLAFRRRDLAV